MVRILIALSAMLVLLLIGAYCYAHDGYEGLHNAQGGDCCGGHDCGPTETRYVGSQLQAHIVREAVTMPFYATPAVDLWVDVPADKILPNDKNPKVGPSACWHQGLGLLCFMFGREG
jgi:hypothetical protein